MGNHLLSFIRGNGLLTCAGHGKRTRAPSHKALMAQEAATKGNPQKGKKVQQLKLQEEIEMRYESRETLNSKAEVDKEHQLAEQKANGRGNGAETKGENSVDTFDISKLAKVGFKLDYVVLEKHGEGSIIDIDLEDIESKVNYWNNVVVAMLKNGVIIVRFDSVEGKEEVLKGGIYHFDNKPFIVKTWSMDMEFTKEELNSVPIWIKLPGLDFKYWSPIGLSKSGSFIGNH
ncbi:hypothetical protein KY284_030106 [Solanum tuberosum]|nr:hypothetical protein KY284_030106 [Solanum tuberosum]